MPPIVLDARTATDHFPGIGRYVVNLASALKHVSPDLDLTLLRDSSAAAQRLTLPDLPALDCAASPFGLQQQWQVRSALYRAGAALYHSPYYLMPYRPGAPAVFTCHDLIPLILRQYFSARQRLIYRFTHQLALNTAQLTIAVSHSTKNDLLRFFRVSPDRIVVVPEGVDDHFKPLPRAELNRVRARYALPDCYLLYLGSNKPHKNVLRLVEAFARSVIREQASGVELVIAGHWDQRYPQAKELAAQLTIAVSHSTKNDLQRLFRVSSDRIVVVPEGVDDHFKPLPRAELDRVRARYALPDCYLLYLGSNKPHKNVLRLVEAFARSNIRERKAGIGLVIAGHWDQRYPQAKALAEKWDLNDRVSFIGPVKDDDLPALYGGAELFVFPSEYEGFGLPVLEAMACGAPVVCSNRSSLPEVAGDAALLCDPHDVEALAHAIAQAVLDRDMRATLQQRSLARAAQFSWEQTAQQTLRIYQSLLET